MEAKLTLYHHDVRVIAPEQAPIGNMLGLLAQSVSKSTRLFPIGDALIGVHPDTLEFVSCHRDGDPEYRVFDRRTGTAVAYHIPQGIVAPSSNFSGMVHRVRHVVSRSDDPRF